MAEKEGEGDQANIKLAPVASSFADAESAKVVAATFVCTAGAHTVVNIVPFDRCSSEMQQQRK